jgi:hypothetical protein
VFLDSLKQPLMYGSMSQDDVNELIEMHENGDYI